MYVHGDVRILCVVESSSRTPQPHCFLKRVFFSAVVCYEAFWFRSRLPRFIHSKTYTTYTEKIDSSSSSSRIHSFSLIYIQLFHCVVCIDTLSLSTIVIECHSVPTYVDVEILIETKTNNNSPVNAVQSHSGHISNKLVEHNKARKVKSENSREYQVKLKRKRSRRRKRRRRKNATTKKTHAERKCFSTANERRMYVHVERVVYRTFWCCSPDFFSCECVPITNKFKCLMVFRPRRALSLALCLCTVKSQPLHTTHRTTR